MNTLIKLSLICFNKRIIETWNYTILSDTETSITFLKWKILYVNIKMLKETEPQINNLSKNYLIKFKHLRNIAITK